MPGEFLCPKCKVRRSLLAKGKPCPVCGHSSKRDKFKGQDQYRDFKWFDSSNPKSSMNSGNRFR